MQQLLKLPMYAMVILLGVANCTFHPAELSLADEAANGEIRDGNERSALSGLLARLKLSDGFLHRRERVKKRPNVLMCPYALA